MKDWTSRLDHVGSSGIRPAPRSFGDVVAGQAMLVPTARQVDDFIRTLPRGRHMGVATLRAEMARRHGAEVTCPVTMGYHLRTVAEAAYEALGRGMAEDRVTPFWRVLDASTPTTGRLGCGAEFVAERRRREGIGD